ncbi:hypothetical protein GIB67_019772 [Kingdonia uniflora]|uniref:DUF7755 domain-containing protein n=1 Tax=Kingdonia uniflora TaxID=39325 RepID=A0A7J7MK42_9MAGN|nr:hypothetical protein GIB67_019772 [Kingdonia uniflora]
MGRSFGYLDILVVVDFLPPVNHICRWRLGGVSVTFLRKDPSDHSDEEEPCNYGLQYEFEDEDIQLGEGGGLSMVELRPSHITQLASLDLFTLLSSASISQSNSVLNREIFNEESMKEYADLKTSLLFYDVMLIFAGTLIASVSSGEESGLAFLTGGVVGFLYLLMLQRSVDVLPAPESISMKGKSGNLEELFGLETVKGSILGIAFALVFAILAVKYGSGVTLVALKPQQILVGMTGFLVCKIAVVLAAFKPMPVRLEDRE